MLYRDFLYAICVAHGYFLTMEVYSPRTFSTRARLTFDDLTAATTFVTKYFNSSSENINLSLHDVCRVICEVIITDISICMKLATVLNRISIVLRNTLPKRSC